MSEIITSRNNRIIIEASKLKDKKYRDQEGLYCFEGRKLFEEALQSKVSLKSVFITEKYQNSQKTPLDSIRCPIYTVTNTVYEKLSSDSAPDGIFCIAEKDKASADTNGTCFILCSVRDPGNLGTCIRSARAFGIDTLILYDSADEYNQKVIRASMGAFFRQSIVHTKDIVSTISELTSKGYEVLPSALSDNSISLNTVNINKKTVFIVGNEGHGVPECVIEACNNRSVLIPMIGDTESLNASVAASLLMWEQSKTLQ
ncbi:MAG: RNA methyltransferase [Ruminococcaceae bacterium]|nr:RNA methyltransferase [Oscillospiraceae bacterium]